MLLGAGGSPCKWPSRVRWRARIESASSGSYSPKGTLNLFKSPMRSSRHGWTPHVIGAVRLAAEHGVTVLRGMRVRSDLRRRGIGGQLLGRLDEALGPATCYCIPYAWLTDQVEVRAHSHVLEVGSGSGGPAVYLAAARGCRVTGVDINEHGVRNAEQLAVARGVADRVTFQTVDASKPLPFPAARFDAVLSNDAMCHISNRLEVLSEWHRVLRPHGRILFTDAMVVTGLVSQEELAVRSSTGFYFFLPPGENERLIAGAGFTLLVSEDFEGRCRTKTSTQLAY